MMFRMFEFEGTYTPIGLLNVALISIMTPRAEALITARHGHMMLRIVDGVQFFALRSGEHPSW